MTEDEVIARIRVHFPNAVLEVSGENCSFEVYVVTPDFTGVSTLERQRTVLGLFGEEIGDGRLHALTVKARTPEELGNKPGLVQIGG